MLTVIGRIVINECENKNEVCIDATNVSELLKNNEGKQVVLVINDREA